MISNQQWIQNQVNDYGRADCLAAFDCDDEMLDAALNGEKGAVYQLAVARNQSARKFFNGLDAMKKALRKDGRPTDYLSVPEIQALAPVICRDGAPGFCHARGLTLASLGKAMSGLPVALHTLAALRSALDNGNGS